MMQFLLAALAAAPADKAVDMPVSSDFDLRRTTGPEITRDRSQDDKARDTPAIPANLRLDTVEGPEVELALAGNGPVIMLGAFGGRHKGMPGLAHVAMGWHF